MNLRTQRLELREAEEGDVAELSAYQADPRYLAHYDRKPDAAEIIGRARRWAMECPRVNIQLVVTLADQSLAIGCAGMRGGGCAPGEAEVGIELDPAHWGKGYASEALRALITFAESTSVLVLHARTAPANKRAHRMLEAAGFSLVGEGEGAQWWRRGAVG